MFKWISGKYLHLNSKLKLVLKFHFISVRSDRSVRFAYREKPEYTFFSISQLSREVTKLNSSIIIPIREHFPVAIFFLQMVTHKDYPQFVENTDTHKCII